MHPAPGPDDVAAGQVVAWLRDRVGTVATGAPVRAVRGFGNVSWHVPTSDGALLVKVARPHLAADKLSSAAEAMRRAHRAGVPTPELIHLDLECGALGGHPVRVQSWVPGRHRDEVLTDEQSVRRFHADLGVALARLHSIPGEGFSSRVGQPGVATWAEYVRTRVGQIAARVEQRGGVAGIDHRALLERAVRIAAEVSPLVPARLVHRDLYEDNLLVAADGTVAAILDFDIAEVWDPLADAVRLRWEVLAPYGPVAEKSFWASYLEAAGPPEEFDARVWVVAVVELVNSINNAVADGSDEFAARMLGWLRGIAAGPRPLDLG